MLILGIVISTLTRIHRSRVTADVGRIRFFPDKKTLIAEHFIQNQLDKMIYFNIYIITMFSLQVFLQGRYFRFHYMVFYFFLTSFIINILWFDSWFSIVYELTEKRPIVYQDSIISLLWISDINRIEAGNAFRTISKQLPGGKLDDKRQNLTVMTVVYWIWCFVTVSLVIAYGMYLFWSVNYLHLCSSLFVYIPRP